MHGSALVDNDPVALSCAQRQHRGARLGEPRCAFSWVVVASLAHAMAFKLSHPERFCAPFDIIVSNPPYVRRGELNTLPLAVREHDPVPCARWRRGWIGRRCARFSPERRATSASGGLLAVEHGHDQGASVRRLFVRKVAMRQLSRRATSRDMSASLQAFLVTSLGKFSESRDG